jgi:hypothetical protein
MARRRFLHGSFDTGAFEMLWRIDAAARVMQHGDVGFEFRKTLPEFAL